MTDKPSTFDIKFDSAGDFDKARELIERMNAELAAKEAQIDALKATIEVLSDKEDLAGIVAGIEDIKMGRLTNIKDIRPKRDMIDTMTASGDGPGQSDAEVFTKAQMAAKDQRIEELEQSEEKLINERDEMEERVNTICEQLDLSESDATWSNLNDPAERACEYIAAKDRRIDEFESQWRVREGYHQKLWNDASDKIHALEAQIDRVRNALSDLLTAHHHSRGDEYVDAAYAALGEPAATPERNRDVR